MSLVFYDYKRSSAAYRVRIALKILGLPYQTVFVDLRADAHKSPENLARNPQGLVPSLAVDGQVISQSLAIIEHLDQRYGAGFLPDQALAKARVRALSYAIAMEVHPVCNLSVARFAVENSGGNITLESWMDHFISKGLAAVERMLEDPKTGRYCQGDSLTMADLCLVPQIYNARRWQVDITGFPRLTQIEARLAAIPTFQAAHPDLVTGD